MFGKQQTNSVKERFFFCPRVQTSFILFNTSYLMNDSLVFQ